MLAVAILLFAISLGAVGQILLKSGITQLGEKPAPTVVISSIFRNPRVAGGFLCYAVSSLFYLVALSRLPLSYAYPMVAFSYVLVTLLAWRLLHEHIPALRLVALGLILLGVLVMALSYSHSPPPEETAALHTLGESSSSSALPG
jgi:drug/metabolite transporter (DMT)-like permease